MNLFLTQGATTNLFRQRENNSPGEAIMHAFTHSSISTTMKVHYAAASTSIEDSYEPVHGLNHSSFITYLKRKVIASRYLERSLSL